MLVLSLILILAGALLAALVERTIGVIVAIIGVVLLVYVLLVNADDADALVTAWSSWSG